MLSVVIALVVVIQDHSKIHFNSAKWLIIYAIPGVPLGILILTYANETLVKTVLAILIIFYALYSLYFKTKVTAKTDSKWVLFVCGFLSGVFGGAYGINGPPLVVYGNLKQWSAKHFRATLQAYFLPISLFSVVGYYAKGLINSTVNYYFLIALAAAIPAIFLGRYLNHQLKDGLFFKYVYWGLLVIGIVLMFSSWLQG